MRRAVKAAALAGIMVAALALAGCPRGDAPDADAANAGAVASNVAQPAAAAPSPGAPPAAPGASAVAPFVGGAATVQANIGANIDGVTYYSVAAQYVDMIRMASPWVTLDSQQKKLQEIDEVDANGWPMEDFQTNVGCCQMPHGIPNNTPGAKSYLVGEYQLSFKGKATLSLTMGSFKNQTYDPATNTTTVTAIRTADDPRYDGDASMVLAFKNTQRTADSPVNTGVTNIHMIRPQYAPNGQKWWDSPSQTFTDPFLKAYSPFTTLRFMDWTMTNWNQQAQWSQRTPAAWPTTGHEMQGPDGTWSGTGQSWESAIELANTLHKDMWINVPAHANDDYVLQLATLLHDKLDPGINVYVEYGNETWNWGFEAWHYIAAWLQGLPTTDPQEAALYDDHCPSGSGSGVACRTAERLMQISNIFAGVWGNGAIDARVRPVLCSQLVGPGHVRDALAFIDQIYGAPSKYFYGICSAPYWGDAVQAGQSVDELLATSKASIPKWDSYLIDWAVIARFYGLHNFTYEGGTGMTDLQAVDVPALLAANADPRMGQQVTEAVTGAFANGVDMYMQFNGASAWTKYGAWGATNDIFDLTEPKYAALLALQGKPITRSLDFTAVNPANGLPYARAATAIPGVIDGGYPRFGGFAGNMMPAGGNRTWCSSGACILLAGGGPDPRFPTNAIDGYAIVVGQAGTYTVTLNLGAAATQGAASARFYVNQQPQGGEMQIPASPAGTPDRKSTSIQVELPAGFSLVELEATKGSFYVASIDITQ